MFLNRSFLREARLSRQKSKRLKEFKGIKEASLKCKTILTIKLQMKSVRRIELKKEEYEKQGFMRCMLTEYLE